MMEDLRVLINLVMVIHLLQWNARSLTANGQEFKKFVSESEVLWQFLSNKHHH